MTAPDLFYELSPSADEDLCEIFDYTAEEFGIEQAPTSLSQLEDTFRQWLHDPLIGRERIEIREGLRRVSKNSHIVFYRILENRLRIVRVLHGSRDLPRYFN